MTTKALDAVRSETRAGLITALKRVIDRTPILPEAVVLFGSWARGDFDGGSDIDLLVIGTDTVPHGQLAALGRPFDVLVLSAADWQRKLSAGHPMATTIARDGIVLHGSLPGVGRMSC